MQAGDVLRVNNENCPGSADWEGLLGFLFGITSCLLTFSEETPQLVMPDSYKSLAVTQ